MKTLSVLDAKTWLSQRLGLEVFLHMEVNPEAYIRNASVQLLKADILGDGPYRVHLQWESPAGILTINDISDMVEDDGVLVFTGYDSQTRIAQTLCLSQQPLSM